MRNIPLFVVAVLLIMILAPLGFVFHFATLIGQKSDKNKDAGKYLLGVSVAIDQLGNSVCQRLFNQTLIKGTGYRFGNEDETISSVLGRNKQRGTLSMLGRLLDFILSAIDANHSIKSIEPSITE